jgi:cytochrome b
MNHGESMQRIRVWDLPTRLFHWILVVLVGVSFTTGEIGGNAMQVHVGCGLTILALLVYRILWGFIGSRPSRFSAFLTGPGTVWRYAATLPDRNAPPSLGHNPLGGWSVAAMLLALIVQVVTGLFANDDIATQGPLYKYVSKAVSDGLSTVHVVNQGVVIALVGIHVAAVLFHLVYKRDNLIIPMLTGDKFWSGDSAAAVPQRPFWLAALTAALAAAAVYFLVR